MNIPEICITFIAALLGVAYPILLEVVSRLDEKYASLVVVNLFKKEKEWKLFRLFLGTSLCSVLVYILINLPFFWSPLPHWFTYSFIVLFLVSTVLLVITFLYFVRKIITYYSTFQIIQYFNTKTENEEHIYFQAILDILHLSIKKQDTVAAKTAAEIIYKAFREVRNSNKDIPVLYPDAYYQLTYKTVQELIFSKDERFIYLEYRTLGGVWFLGEHESARIHESTFAWMWRALVLAVRHDRGDMFMQYWSNAHRHFIYDLKAVDSERVLQGENFVVTNQAAITLSNDERERFLEFNYALGGLLLYQKRISVIGRMFKYTTSSPPSYDLLPLTMNEVFALYFKFRDPYDYNFPFIHARYNFPDSEGIHAEGIVKNWINKYAALLFLRQYSIVAYYVYMQPLAPPNIPVKQSEKRLWLENLDHFRSLVSELLSDNELLDQVGFGYMTEQWFTELQAPAPLDLLDTLKQTVDQAFEDTEQNQAISELKKQAFVDSTKEIISQALTPYREKLANDVLGVTKSWFVMGLSMVAEKSAFSDNQNADHTNFDSFLAGRVASQVRKGISETFHMKDTESYLLKTPDLFAALDKLALDGEKYIIVNFGIDLSYHIEYTKVAGLTTESYQSVNIITFSGYNAALMNPTFYVLKKSNLPAIIFRESSDESIAKYALNQVDDTIHLYTSVIDLNANEVLRNELAASDDYAQLEKSVLMYIGLNIEIKWKKEIKMLALSQYSEFKNRGAANDLDDVKW